jgi:hypothetical protein
MAAAAALATTATVGGTFSAFTSRTASSGNTVGAARAFAPPVLASVPDLLQAGVVGREIPATTDGFTGNGLSFAFQWFRCPAAGGTCATQPIATTATYTPTSADAGQRIVVTVTATNDAGSTSATSLPTQAVTASNGTSATDFPEVSGTARVGSTLTASAGSWSAGFQTSFQWLRCSAVGDACAAIGNATSSTYTPVAADRGLRLRARVTRTALLYPSATVETADTGVIG